jgi:hypothetical protein
MAIKAIATGKRVEFELEGYDSGRFRLADRGGAYDDIFLSTPLELDVSFQNKQFDIFYLAKKEVKENDIFQVFDDLRNTRIGWCIPVNALDSTEHDFSKNPHFLKYAYIAIQSAIAGISDNVYTKEIDVDTYPEIRLTDIFHSYTVILVISRETLVVGKPFELPCAIPSLMKYGYVRLDNKSPANVALSCLDLKGERIRLKLVSSSLNNPGLIDSLLHSAFAYETNVVLCFFYLYQVFELLLEQVYQVEQAMVVEDLISAAGNASKAKDALEKVQRISSEKKRMHLLVNEYSESLERLASLKESCNEFLKEIGRNEGATFEEYFYGIRNFIFHQYRDFPVDKEDLLHEVVTDAREWLPEVLSTFRVSSRTAA